MALPATGNLLLDSLPSGARRTCLQSGERCEVECGQEIFRENDLASHAFFPVGAVCSMTIGLNSGAKTEVALVGAEGFIGVSLIHGPRHSWFGATVQVSGLGYWMPLPVLADLFNRNRPFREAMLLYSWYSFNVLGRSAPCSGSHSITERLARWLLATQDRVKRATFPFTHYGASEMLAAARPSVSLAAGRLKAARVIGYKRGQIAILDRRRLEQMACECYETMQRYEQFLPWLPGAKASRSVPASGFPPA